MKKSLINNFGIISCIFLTGCAIGYDTALFMTKSNIGLDVDTKPPTAEISIARREGVLAPGFEGGQTPPVFARFGTSSGTSRGNSGESNTDTGRNVFDKFFWGISSVFAGGNAAIYASQNDFNLSQSADLPDPAEKQPSSLHLTMLPQGKPSILGIPLGTIDLPQPGEMKPFIFGTDTSFGLKVAWSGLTGNIPDTLRLGFNRKELAIAPIFGKPVSSKAYHYQVDMPSFFATIKIAGDAGIFGLPKNEYSQIFATGKAADNIAQSEKIKEGIQRLTTGATFDFKPDSNSACISKWRGNDNSKIKIMAEWCENHNPPIECSEFINGSFSKEREEFVRANNVPAPCP